MDGTQLATAGGNGAVCFGQLVERFVCLVITDITTKGGWNGETW